MEQCNHKTLAYKESAYREVAGKISFAQCIVQVITLLFFITLSSWQLFGNTFDERDRKGFEKATKLLFDNIADFNKECFLIGTLDDNNGHYQTFTSNKSIDDVDASLRWLFDKENFTSDPLADKLVTMHQEAWIALFTKYLFEKEAPDIKVLGVKNATLPYAFGYYGKELLSVNGKRDTLCNKVGIFSQPLANIVSGYYTFDKSDSSLPIVFSSGGDIGYRGKLLKNKFVTKEQKLSYLAGVLLCHFNSLEITVQWARSNMLSFQNSLSKAGFSIELLKELGCERVVYIDGSHGQIVLFHPSEEVRKLCEVIEKVQRETMTIIAY